MQLKSLCILVLLGLGTATSTTTSRISYEGYKVYKVIAKTEAENVVLKHLETNADFHFWSRINKVGKPVAIMASPKAQEEFENLLQSHNIEYSTQIENVQNSIDAERNYHLSRKMGNPRISFDQYYRHAEINAYLDRLGKTYADLVTVSTIGRSYENRTMNIIHISSSDDDALPKPVIFIEAGMHANEWIGPAFALYIINQLVENPDNRNLLDDLDWIVLPSMNPDGYEYTWEINRMWRKTRSPGVICDGTDGNRNFDFHWMEAGASDDECSDIYAGKEAFSEPETRNLRDVLAATQNISAFISIHSYGQYLFYPFSYDDVVPDNWQELRSLAQQVSDVIFAINGTEYSIGSSTEVLYKAAGCSDDWAMGAAGIDIVYVFELPGGGEEGFDLPPERILPVCSETWEGLKVIADYIVQNKK